MRLICPNCGAQYEVPESVIPEAGRDVQCSGCGHTWFQHHPNHAPQTEDTSDADDWDSADDDSAEASLFADDAPEPEPAKATAESEAEEEWQGFPQDPGLIATPPRAGLQPDPEDPVSRLPEVEEDDYEEDPARDLPMPRRRLDSSVADLLREEAEREARARAAERRPGLETQPDLGLDTAPARAPAPDRTDTVAEPPLRRPATEAPPAPPRAAAPQPEPAPAAPAPESDDRLAAIAAAAVAESRRGLLPDIEEINSSLRATSDRRPARADDHDVPGQSADPRQIPDQGKPRGFSRGFSVTLLIAVLLLALYVFAPALAQSVPAASPVLSGYVSAIDGLRQMLDAQAQNLSRWLAEIAGSTS
jgi:predicted Zn finger-like uncharacterized protein